MKKVISLFLVIAVIVSVCSISLSAFAAEGTTYYVSSSLGDDSNNGLSQENAFKTLNKISSMTFSAGDKILLKAGDVFNDSLYAKGSGTEENPIFVGSYGDGAQPLITVTQSRAIALYIFDVSNWTVDNLELTAPNGNAAIIRFFNSTVRNITLDNLKIHDVNNFASDTYHSAERAAMIFDGASNTPGTRLENIFINNCEIYNCGYGIHAGGNFPNTENTPYNKNIIVDECSIHDIWDDAFIMARTDGIILRNSSVIRACQSSGLYYTAPVWMWGVTNALVENCEIAGSKNVLDGMAVDFDDHTDHSTYQYVYSHDNTRFMWNCPYESDDHYNNMVRYCLSVNDGSEDNCGGYEGTPEHNFMFYNNTIVGGGTYVFNKYSQSSIKNNIFMLDPGSRILFSKNFENDVSSNCYFNIIKPFADSKSINANPQFAGNDYSDVNSFILKKVSPLIGKGVQVEEDMGEHDFYGNALTKTHNIGCYEGTGTDGEFVHDNLCKILKRVINYISAIVKKTIDHDVEWLNKQINKLLKK